MDETLSLAAATTRATANNLIPEEKTLCYCTKNSVRNPIAVPLASGKSPLFDLNDGEKRYKLYQMQSNVELVRNVHVTQLTHN